MSAVQAGGGGVAMRGIFSWHTFGLIDDSRHHGLKATAFYSAMVSIHTSPNDCFLHDEDRSERRSSVIPCRCKEHLQDEGLDLY